MTSEEMPCLPSSITPHGAECWIAGKGKTENGSRSSGLRSMTINAMDRDYCIDGTHRYENDKVTRL